MATLVMLELFCSVVVNFLIVAHTHEDVDQLFGCIRSWLQEQGCWDCPDDVLKLIVQMPGSLEILLFLNDSI